MKITDECINSIALKHISDEIGDLFGYSGDEKDFDNMRLIALGEIYGIITFASELKKVSKE